MITIDGTGDRDGEILASALSLSLSSGKGFRMRAPGCGLLRHHVAAVKACLAISESRATGATVGSRELEFRPGAVRPGEYRCVNGGAGGIWHLLRVMVLPLLRAPAKSRLVLGGATHTPSAPTCEWIERVYLPALGIERHVNVRVEREGVHPAGGGCVVVEVLPTERLRSPILVRRASPVAIEARAYVFGLPYEVGMREIAVLEERFRGIDVRYRVVHRKDASSPGNVLTVEVTSEESSEIFSVFGEKRMRAEIVAETVADQVLQYLAHDAPLAPTSADQLLVPSVWAGGGELIVQSVSSHLERTVALLRQFDVEVRADRSPDNGVCVVIGAGRSKGTNV